MKMFEKIKQRWGIERTVDLWLILVVFSLSGSSVLFVRRFLFDLLGISRDTVPLLLYIALYIVLIVPSYYLLTLLWGYLFGQYSFFLQFSKKSLGRFIPKKRA